MLSSLPVCYRWLISHPRTHFPKPPTLLCRLAVRYTAAVTGKFASSIAPHITTLLVHGKQVNRKRGHCPLGHCMPRASSNTQTLLGSSEASRSSINQASASFTHLSILAAILKSAYLVLYVILFFPPHSVLLAHVSLSTCHWSQFFLMYLFICLFIFLFRHVFVSSKSFFLFICFVQEAVGPKDS